MSSGPFVQLVNNLFGGMIAVKHIKLSFLLTSFLAGMSFQVVAGGGESKPALDAEAVQIVKTFAGTLKPKLKSAIQSGGFVHAIDICSVEAPKIAASLSAETGWDIKRVSLKARNKSSATPDTFERMVLEQFDERQANGEKASGMMFSEVVGNEYRFMKAQGVQGLCFNCHGGSLQPEVEKAIAERYPEDMATGYSLGQIRGAFSLTKVL